MSVYTVNKDGRDKSLCNCDAHVGNGVVDEGQQREKEHFDEYFRRVGHLRKKRLNDADKADAVKVVRAFGEGHADVVDELVSVTEMYVCVCACVR